MSFILNARGDLINEEEGLMLAHLADTDSPSGFDEYYILNSDYTMIENHKVLKTSLAYRDIEQALDDFEYVTTEIPKTIISEFKKAQEREYMTKITNSDRSDLFSLSQDGDSMHLLHIPSGYQLNYTPARGKGKEDEYTITFENLEEIEDYETLATSFTTDPDEALDFFTAMVGKVPTETKEHFMNNTLKYQASEKYEGFVIMDIDGKVLSYVDDQNVDFLDTVDEPDGGYSKACIFTTKEEAEQCLINVGLEKDPDIEVISSKEAFAFVEEEDSSISTSDKKSDLKRRNEFVVIDEDGKVLSDYYNSDHELVIGYIDTVDDPDGGYQRAHKFFSPSTAEQVLRGWNYLDGRPYEIMSAYDAFLFTEENSSVSDLGGMQCYQPDSTDEPFIVYYDEEGFQVEYIDDHEQEDMREFTTVKEVVDFVKEIYPSADLEALQGALQEMQNV